MKKYRKYIIAVSIILSFLIALCFIPIGISKFIPAIEAAVKKDFGVDVKMEKLVLRLGPTLKVKTPKMHLLYDNGQKFADLNAVKFYIPWSSLIKNKPEIHLIKVQALNINLNSDDKYLKELVENLKSKDISELPNIVLHEYNFSYYNKDSDDKYIFSGQSFGLNKVSRYKSMKLTAKGFFSINQKQYVNYDFSVLPKFDIEINDKTFDFEAFVKGIKTLDFHSDIVSDLKLYKNDEGYIQSSGFINIDNMSVLDKTGKNPKSFAYITLLGDKASVLSNIYTEGNKKIYLEGMINNSQKPVVDIKVKSDEINLEDLYDKLKIFVNLSGLKNIDSIKGTLNANFALKGDLKKIKSTGFLKISNGTISANGVNINNINSDIDFSNNVINITNAVGYVNNSPVLAKGKIDKNIDIEVLMNKVDLTHLVPENFGVKSGILSLVANFGGTFEKPIHKENLQIENLSVNKGETAINADSIKYDTNKSGTAYINNIVVKTPYMEQIKIPSIRIPVEKDLITIPETNIFMPNSKVTVKGSILNYYNNDITFNAVLDGFINSSDILAIKQDATKYPIKIVANGDKNSQNINSQVLIEKTSILDEPAVLNLVSKVSKNSLKIEDLSLTGFSGKFENDLKTNLKGSKKLVLSGNVDNFENPVFKNFRIYTPQILSINSSDIMAQVKSDIFVNGDIKKPEFLGQLFIQNLRLNSAQTTITNGTIDFNKLLVSVNFPLVKIADSTVGVNSNILIDFSKPLTLKNLNVKSKYLNTDTLLMYKDAPFVKTLPVEISDGKFYAERLQSSVYGESVYMNAFVSNLKLKNNLLSLENISSEIFNGKMQGSLNFDLKDESFESNIMARSVSAAPIFDIISTRKDTISGVVDFDTNLKGNLSSKKTLNGNIKFIVQNGRMSTLGKLEHLLYAQNIIADNMLRTSLNVVAKAITLKDTGLFKYLRGDVALKDGVANIKMLQSQGPLMALYIKGLYYPDTDYAKLVVLGRVADEVINGLGAFGEFSFNKLMIMLTGEEPKYKISQEDYEMLPQLTSRNTKEFRAIINGIIDKPSSVLLFNWVSYSQKSLRQKEVPMNNTKVPAFVDELPY